MGIFSQVDLWGKNKVEVVIARLQEFEPPEGYYIAFSGGKDSIVLYDLVKKSGVKHDVHFNATTVDPPELLTFITKNYPEVIWDRPNRNMYALIRARGIPTRRQRKCCEELKEAHGRGRFIVTGVRAQESAQRARRKMTELCTRYVELTRYLHPIIDWTEKDVWEYIRVNKMPYCSLYDEGFKRIGCVLCPMGTSKQAQIEAARFPKVARALKLAMADYIERHPKSFTTMRDRGIDAIWDWWMNREGTRKEKNDNPMFV